MNSVTKINLSNLKNCNQIWADMPKNERGRLCQKCQNTVIDFRNKNDSEVAEIHLFTEGKVCGLYNKKQVQIPKRKKKTKKINLWNGIYIGLFSLMSFKSFGQNEKINTASTEQLEKDFDAHKNQKIDKNISSKRRIQKDSIYITGTLKDSEDLPLPGANVIIKDTRIGASTDFDGNYRLNVTKPLDSLGKIILSYSYIGYKTVEITIDSDSVKQKENRRINVKLNEGEVIEYIVIEKAPIHKRIWYGIKNIFKKKK